MKTCFYWICLVATTALLLSCCRGIENTTNSTSESSDVFLLIDNNSSSGFFNSTAEAIEEERIFRVRLLWSISMIVMIVVMCISIATLTILIGWGSHAATQSAIALKSMDGNLYRSDSFTTRCIDYCFIDKRWMFDVFGCVYACIYNSTIVSEIKHVLCCLCIAVRRRREERYGPYRGRINGLGGMRKVDDDEVTQMVELGMAEEYAYGVAGSEDNNWGVFATKGKSQFTTVVVGSASEQDVMVSADNPDNSDKGSTTTDASAIVDDLYYAQSEK